MPDFYNSDDLPAGRKNKFLTGKEKQLVSALQRLIDEVPPELTPADIKLLYEQNPNTNPFTDAEKVKLSRISEKAPESAVSQINGRKGDVKLTADDIPNGRRNFYMTQSERAKLALMETVSPKALSNRDIREAYDTLVPVASREEAESGRSKEVRRWTPERIAQAVTAHVKAAGGAGKKIKQSIKGLLSSQIKNDSSIVQGDTVKDALEDLQKYKANNAHNHPNYVLTSVLSTLMVDGGNITWTYDPSAKAWTGSVSVPPSYTSDDFDDDFATKSSDDLANASGVSGASVSDALDTLDAGKLESLVSFVTISGNTGITSAAHHGKVLRVTGNYILTLPNNLPAGFQCAVFVMAGFTATIRTDPADSSTLNEITDGSFDLESHPNGAWVTATASGTYFVIGTVNTT